MARRRRRCSAWADLPVFALCVIDRPVPRTTTRVLVAPYVRRLQCTSLWGRALARLACRAQRLWQNRRVPCAEPWRVEREGCAPSRCRSSVVEHSLRNGAQAAMRERRFRQAECGFLRFLGHFISSAGIILSPFSRLHPRTHTAQVSLRGRELKSRGARFASSPSSVLGSTASHSSPPLFSLLASARCACGTRVSCERRRLPPSAAFASGARYLRHQILDAAHRCLPHRVRRGRIANRGKRSAP